MSAGFLGFVLGAALAVALGEVGAFRRRQAAALGGWPRDRHPTNWESTMPPPRSSLRPRWESSSDPADEDDLIEFLVTVVAVVLLAGGIFFGSSALARFLTFLVCGAALGAAGVGGYAWLTRRELPPGGRHVVVRGLLVALVAGIALHWFERTRFRGSTFDAVHTVVLRVNLLHRPGQVHKVFDTDGVLLYASLAFGVMFAVGLLATVLVDVMAMLAATRLGEGSRRAFDGWLAQLYPRRQLRLWVSTGIVAVVTVLLVAGTVLGWYDHYQRNNDINPATVPIVADPPGLVVPLTVPGTAAGETTVAVTSTPVAPVDTASTPVAPVDTVPVDPAAAPADAGAPATASP